MKVKQYKLNNASCTKFVLLKTVNITEGRGDQRAGKRSLPQSFRSQNMLGIKDEDSAAFIPYHFTESTLKSSTLCLLVTDILPLTEISAVFRAKL